MELFRACCFECHGSGKTNARVKVLDRYLLLITKRKVVPGKPEASPLLRRLVTATR